MTPAKPSEIHVTPAGVKIAYFDKSHRYKIGKDYGELEFVPSVSTVLDVLPKNLSGWAERLGVAGALALLAENPDAASTATVDGLLDSMKAAKLRYWQVRDQAALRGTSVHKAFETLADGAVPKLSDYPLSERGYIRGIARWWMLHEPEVVASELMVASWEHRYAGRMDLLAKVDGRLGVIDLKTSKGIRESHHFQTAGYRLAVHESGYGTTDFGAVLRVGADGESQYVETWATESQFLAIREQYLAIKQFERDTPTEHKRRRKAA